MHLCTRACACAHLHSPPLTSIVLCNARPAESIPRLEGGDAGSSSLATPAAAAAAAAPALPPGSDAVPRAIHACTLSAGLVSGRRTHSSRDPAPPKPLPAAPIWCASPSEAAAGGMILIFALPAASEPCRSAASRPGSVGRTRLAGRGGRGGRAAPLDAAPLLPLPCCCRRSRLCCSRSWRSCWRRRRRTTSLHAVPAAMTAQTGRVMASPSVAALVPRGTAASCAAPMPMLALTQGCVSDAYTTFKFSKAFGGVQAGSLWSTAVCWMKLQGGAVGSKAGGVARVSAASARAWRAAAGPVFLNAQVCHSAVQHSTTQFGGVAAAALLWCAALPTQPSSQVGERGAIRQCAAPGGRDPAPHARAVEPSATQGQRSRGGVGVSGWCSGGASNRGGQPSRHPQGALPLPHVASRPEQQTRTMPYSTVQFRTVQHGRTPPLFLTGSPGSATGRAARLAGCR